MLHSTLPWKRGYLQLLTAAIGCSLASASVAADTTETDSNALVPGFSIESSSVSESVGTAQIVITLSEAASTEVGVAISSQPDTAINGQDFYGFYYPVKFAPGETSKTVTVSILNDEEVEDDESLNLRLFANTKDLTTIVNGNAILTIEDDDEDDDANPGGIWRPAPGTSWQWQLTGNIDTSFDVDMYNIDLFDVPQSVIDRLHDDGRIVICYFSAGSYEDWRPDANSFPESVKGSSNGWPGEKWLDIRALDRLGPIMAARLDRAAERGCDGVEPDNIDGHTNRTGFPLTGADQIRYNKWLAEQAHARGLSIGLKNDLEQARELEPFFDWALNEQCFQYNECERLVPFVEAGKAVFGVEYQGSLSSFCPQLNALNFDWLKKNLNLGAQRESCR